MSRRAGIRSAGVGRRPRFTFWLTFSQSCMLPLFFIGLLSYLVGMKRRTSRCVICKRNNSHFLRYVLISPCVRSLPLFVNLFEKPVHNAFRHFSCYLFLHFDPKYLKQVIFFFFRGKIADVIHNTTVIRVLLSKTNYA